MEQENNSSSNLANEHQFKRLYDIIRKLRAPDGCPWDIEQSPQTLRGSLIEETYECVEAIDEGNAPHVQEELGDVFLLAVMLSYMYEQEGAFTVADVLNGINEKLIRRHPHVFGGETVKDSDEVLVNWAKIKVEQEGRTPKDSVLDEVSLAMPPLDRAYKLQKKAAKTGFDWKDVSGIFDKITEETGEVKDEIAKSNGEITPELECELGDLLFSVVNLCRFYKIEPSVALNRTNNKWTSRFKEVEKRMKEANLAMTSENVSKMEEFWEAAKNT
jgi:tetrapyrrole methylase family protein/MazG family protein